MTDAERRSYLALRDRLRSMAAKTESLCSGCRSASGVVVVEPDLVRAELRQELIEFCEWIRGDDLHQSHRG